MTLQPNHSDPYRPYEVQPRYTDAAPLWAAAYRRQSAESERTAVRNTTFTVTFALPQHGDPDDILAVRERAISILREMADFDGWENYSIHSPAVRVIEVSLDTDDPVGVQVGIEDVLESELQTLHAAGTLRVVPTDIGVRVLY